MNDNERAIAERLADRLVRGLAASRVVWFGSRAAGEGRPGSGHGDLDAADATRALSAALTVRAAVETALAARVRA
jgi:hypothetical protein